jgi:hypothetical protein
MSTDAPRDLRFKDKLTLCEAHCWAQRCCEQVEICGQELQNYKLYYSHLEAEIQGSLDHYEGGQEPALYTKALQNDLPWGVLTEQQRRGVKVALHMGEVHAKKQASKIKDQGRI